MASVDFICNSKKIKYTLLSEIFEDYNVQNELNIVLDFHSLFDVFRMDFYKEPIKKQIGTKYGTDLAAGICNIVGHYRNYCYRNNIKNKVLLINSSKRDLFKESIIDTYYDNFINNHLNPKFMDYVFSKVKSTLENVSGVTCVDGVIDDNSGIDPFVLTNLVIRNNSNDILFKSKNSSTVFITSSEFQFQNLNLLPNSFVLLNTLSKVKCFGQNKYFQYIVEKNKYKSEGLITKVNNISDTYIPVLLGLKGTFNIDGICKPRQAIDKIIDLSENYNYTFNISNLDNIINHLKISEDKQELFTKLLLLGSVSHEIENITDGQKYKINSNISVGNTNERLLHKINTNYFNSKIDIQMIY